MTAGIVIGIASLAVLTSVGEATKHLTMQRFKNMIGTFDTVIVPARGSKITWHAHAGECAANLATTPRR